ncbi:hypothetical protein [Nocardia sp. JCM 34519.1]|uniref:hypothetical protein n=1 Tax=unclassified Nocardia TaxID=2637762 RepID=UPI0035A8A5E1
MRIKARRRRPNLVDATCPLLSKVHSEAKRFAAHGYTIALICHDGHEQVEGTLGEGLRSAGATTRKYLRTFVIPRSLHHRWRT